MNKTRSLIWVTEASAGLFNYCVSLPCVEIGSLTELALVGSSKLHETKIPATANMIKKLTIFLNIMNPLLNFLDDLTIK